MSLKNKVILSISIGLIVSMIFSTAGFAAKCEKVSENVLRLHIVAASDSEEDQHLKLKVRDAVLEKSSSIFDGSVDIENAVDKITPELPLIRQTARQIIQENGYDYDVDVSLKKEYFKTRVYDGFTMPPGEYLALRIVIGEGKGHNWWCVMYPAMCLPSARAEDNAKNILGDKIYRFIGRNPKYEPRFKIIEVIEELKYKISNR